MKKTRHIEYSANIAVIKACNTVLLYVKWTEMVTVTVLSEVKWTAVRREAVSFHPDSYPLPQPQQSPRRCVQYCILLQ